MRLTLQAPKSCGARQRCNVANACRFHCQQAITQTAMLVPNSSQRHAAAMCALAGCADSIEICEPVPPGDTMQLYSCHTQLVSTSHSKHARTHIMSAEQLVWWQGCAAPRRCPRLAPSLSRYPAAATTAPRKASTASPRSATARGTRTTAPRAGAPCLRRSASQTQCHPAPQRREATRAPCCHWPAAARAPRRPQATRPQRTSRDAASPRLLAAVARCLAAGRPLRERRRRRHSADWMAATRAAGWAAAAAPAARAARAAPRASPPPATAPPAMRSTRQSRRTERRAAAPPLRRPARAGCHPLAAVRVAV